MVKLSAPTRRVLASVAAVIGLTATLTGCDVASALRNEDNQAQSVGTDNGNGTSASDTSANNDEPANQHWTDGVSSSENCSGEQTLTGIRVGRHDGFDRIVFDLDGESKPCFEVTFDPNPMQDGSGNPIDFGDYQALRVELTNLGPEFPTPVPGYTAQLDGTYVGYATFDTFFEGVATNFIAVREGVAQYSVDALPGKLVVDVRTQ